MLLSWGANLITFVARRCLIAFLPYSLIQRSGVNNKKQKRLKALVCLFSMKVIIPV
jgi:hypothetical protein